MRGRAVSPWEVDLSVLARIGPNAIVRSFHARLATVCASVAQLAEQLICNQQVGGSSPFASSSRLRGRSCQPSGGRRSRQLVCVLLFVFVEFSQSNAELRRIAPSERLRSTGGFPSGQRGQTVNLMAMPSQVRILHPPFAIYRSEAISGRRTNSSRISWQGSRQDDVSVRFGIAAARPEKSAQLTSMVVVEPIGLL